MPASKRRRVFDRAAVAWHDGKPYRAYAILADAGMGEHWQLFQRTALADARDRFLRRMSAA